MGNIPKNRDREELLEEFSKHARKSAIEKTEWMAECLIQGDGNVS